MCCAATARSGTAGTPPLAPRCGSTQPTFRSTNTASLALGQNGNLINTRELAALLGEAGQGRGGIAATSDTDVLTALFVSDRVPPGVSAGGPAGASAGTPAGTPAADPAGDPAGAYSLVFMDEQTLYAARDLHGFRPLVLCPP